MPQTSIEGRVIKLEEWRDFTHDHLWGRNGHVGLIREHNDDRAARAGTEKFQKRCIAFVSALSGIIGLLHIAQFFHWIP